MLWTMRELWSNERGQICVWRPSSWILQGHVREIPIAPLPKIPDIVTLVLEISHVTHSSWYHPS
jgi:hypothetical protein